jgi:uncharacterized protein (TIGR03437 family)
MSYRAIVSCSLLLLLAGEALRGQSVTVTATPGNINLTYLQGAALPAAQTITAKASATGATFTSAIAPPAPWLTLSPDAGALPAKVVVHVNPTGLAVGTYTAAVTFTPAAAVPPGTAATTNVKLVVTAPLPVLALSPTSLNFANPPAPAAQTVQLTTTGGPVSFAADAGKSTWLTVAPPSGVVVPGGPVTLTVTADATTLSPQVAAYTGKITLTEIGAAGKSQTIAVTFTNNYQLPTVTSIWPPNGKAGGPAATVTIRGTNFGAATVAKIQGTPNISLATTYYSPTAMNAIIPAAQMAAGSTLTILATNPAPGGDSATTVPFAFGATVDAAVSAASYVAGGAPGELLALFGENIGPTTPASLTVTAGYVDKTLSGVGVKIDGKDAPIVYVSQNMVTVQVPYAATIGVGDTIVVTNGVTTANGTVNVAATAPGIFMVVDTAGVLWAVALNVSGITGISLNSASNAVHVGDSVALYLTGEGVYTNIPTPVDGYVIPPGTTPTDPAMPLLAAGVTATIGGVNAPVTYAGAFGGGMLGVLQVNLTVPPHTTSTKGVPVVVTVGGNGTQSGVVIATRP